MLYTTEKTETDDIDDIVFKQKKTLETALAFAKIIRGFADKKFEFAYKNNCPKA